MLTVVGLPNVVKFPDAVCREGDVACDEVCTMERRS